MSNIFSNFKTDKIKTFFKRYFIYFFTFFIIIFFPLCAYYLSKIGIITNEDFADNVLRFEGWVVALLIAWIHIRKNREDNLIIQNNKIIKRLGVEAFKEVNRTIENTATVLAKMETFYFYICRQVEETNLDTVDPPSLLLNTLEKIYNEMNQVNISLPELWQKFNLNFKAHEIILGEFEKLRSGLEIEFQTIILLTIELGKYFTILKTKENLTIKDILTLKKECKNVEKKINKISSLLAEYRIAITNQILGPIFGRKLLKKTSA